MKNLRQQITIDKPIAEVFSFTIDPANTPKWVDSIVTEKTDEWPVKLGTIYRNQDRTGVWTEYRLTVFEPCSTFTLTKQGGDYLRYTFTSPSNDTTELLYEWMGEELEEALLKKILTKLKVVIEAE